MILEPAILTAIHDNKLHASLCQLSDSRFDTQVLNACSNTPARNERERKKKAPHQPLAPHQRYGPCGHHRATHHYAMGSSLNKLP